MSREPTQRARQAAIAVLVASAAVVGAALGFQYLGGLAPCELCLLERWPYYIAIFVAFIATVLATRIDASWALALCGLLFVAGAGLGFYHLGVEQHWFAGPTACTGPAEAADSVAALKAQIMGQQPVRCDEVRWRFLGLSLAGWNFVVSLVLAAFSLAAWYRLTSDRRPA
jgi:disulfide bond formation protein DsbB